MASSYDRPPDGFDAWIAALSTVTRTLHQLEEELEAATDLPLAWFEILIQLEGNCGSMCMSDLADVLVVSRSGITRIIGRMEAAGYVRRHIPPENRRTTLALLTKEGRKACEQAKPVHWEGVRRHFTDHLTKSDLEALRRIMSKIPIAQGCRHATAPPPL